MWQRLLWLALGLAAVVGVAVWFDRSLDPINAATFERVKVGMTIDGARSMISIPPVEGTLDSRLRECEIIKKEINETSKEPWLVLSWWGRQFGLIVCYDSGNTVTCRAIVRLHQENPSIPDRI